MEITFLSLFKPLLILLGTTILSFEITLNSSLAEAMKRYFNLTLDKKSNIDVFKQKLFWQALVGKRWITFFNPFIFIITKFFKFWKWINDLFNCPFCLGYHLAWIALMLIADYSFLNALGVALFSILLAKVYDKIN